MPHISVVMPVRDGGTFLVPAIASILNQTHADLELILVDDGSTDGAVEALDINDARLRIIPCRGSGVADAFNTGWAQAGGDYIARMDADDVALPERLVLQLALLASRPEVDIAGGCVEIFATGGIDEGNRLYQEWLNALREPADIHREIYIESPLPNPTALFRRTALERLGGYRNTSWAEDYDLYLRADRQGMQMAKPEPVLLRWRDHDRRLTRTDVRNFREAFQQAKAHHLVRGGLATGGLLIWGAGPGGRLMHDLLTEAGAGVSGFVDVHPRRIGGTKRGLPVWPLERAANWQEGLVLVAVGARGARAEIRAFMCAHDRHEGRDFLFVA